jgi:hypothetical protein
LVIALAHRHRSILGAISHIILTPANQWMVMGKRQKKVQKRRCKERKEKKETKRKEKKKKK